MSFGLKLNDFLLVLKKKEKILFLDKLFFKILATETDLDFQENLHVYLPKLIEKLSTNEEIVRKRLAKHFGFRQL